VKNIRITKIIDNGRFYALLAVLILAGAPAALAQDESKGIQSEELIKKRPPSKKTAQTPKPTTGKSSAQRTAKTTPARRKNYRVVKRPPAGLALKSSPAVQNETEDALLGVTVWKIRPADQNDAAKELIEEEVNSRIQSGKFTLERMESETPLAEGERIRISIESLSHSGFLYIIDRELYSDGTYSRPKLIYPTLRTRNRAKPVGAGELIFIPEAPRYFRVKSKQSEKTQVAEVLTIIISPKALIEPALLQTRAIDLAPEQFDGWINEWTAATTVLEEIGGAGQTITLVEQNAGQNTAKGLTEESPGLSQDDPTPQTVFRARIKRGNPLLINLPLNYRTP